MNEYLPPSSLPALPRSGGELAIPQDEVSSFALAGEEESVLRHYWRILYKRRYLILALTALGVAIGIFVSMMTRPEYAGTVMLQVAREEAKVLNIEGVEQEGGGPRFDAEFYQTQYALLKSRSISESGLPTSPTMPSTGTPSSASAPAGLSSGGRSSTSSTSS